MPIWQKWILGIGAALVIIGVLNARHSSSPAAIPAAVSQSSAIDGLASDTGEKSQALQTAVDRLSSFCTEPEDRLTNEIRASVDDLASYGIKQSAAGFAAATQKAATPIAPTKCVGVMAELLVLMEK
jgi:hypothetical protein